MENLIRYLLKGITPVPLGQHQSLGLNKLLNHTMVI